MVARSHASFLPAYLLPLALCRNHKRRLPPCSVVGNVSSCGRPVCDAVVARHVFRDGGIELEYRCGAKRKQTTTTTTTKTTTTTTMTMTRTTKPNDTNQVCGFGHLGDGNLHITVRTPKYVIRICFFPAPTRNVTQGSALASNELSDQISGVGGRVSCCGRGLAATSLMSARRRAVAVGV